MDTYEIKRRWYGFWRGMADNSWFRNRIVGFFVVALVVAGDLAYFMFGQSIKALIVGGVLTVLYFWLYEHFFRILNGSILLQPKFGFVAKSNPFLMVPTFTIALSCLIKLAWLQFHGPWWLWWLLSIGIRQGIRVLSAIRSALELLAKHEYNFNCAEGFLRRSAAHAVDPAKMAFDTLQYWVKDVTGESIDISDVDIHKTPLS